MLCCVFAPATGRTSNLQCDHAISVNIIAYLVGSRNPWQHGMELIMSYVLPEDRECADLLGFSAGRSKLAFCAIRGGSNGYL